jgi:hypothetical protein
LPWTNIIDTTVLRNGGKEVVDDYLERTKQDVAESERYLRSILGYLRLDPLPPIKGKL